MAEVTPGVSTPVENAPAADAVPAPDAPTGQEQADESVQPKTLTEDEHKELVDKRVNERLTKERRRLERTVRAELERDFYKQQLESRQVQQPAQQPQGKPQPTDFKDYESFMEAMTDWKVDQRLAKERESAQRETSTQQQQRQALEQAQFVQQNLIAKGQEKYEDFNEVVMGNIPITQPMVEAASRLKNGHDVLYQLAQNPQEVIRISQLPPVEQVWELKDLASKLAGASPTQTPPPIVPNAGKTSVRKSTFELSVNNEAEWQEFNKRRWKELGRRR